MSVPAFFLFLTALLLIHSANAAQCGDGQCYLGYDKVGFILNLSDWYMEGELKTEEFSDYTLNGTTFLIKIISTDRTSIKANIQINTTDINATNAQKTLAIGENFSYNGLRLEVQNILTDFENEETLCPQDCFGGAFVRLDEIFNLGIGVCRSKYRFTEWNNETNTIVMKSEKTGEAVNLSYNTNTSNQFGYPLLFETKMYETNFQFNMRYNEDTAFLYLEDANQTCPIVEDCASNNDCNDNNACTIDECDGDPLKCKYKHIVWCRDDDGCCPDKCNNTMDNDCKLPGLCTDSSECDDNNNCTVDLCTGEPTNCVNQPIINYTSGDNCCPPGGNNTVDSDCLKPVICGDKICEVDETKENCCSDCGCNINYECLNNTCAKSQRLIAEETVNANEDFKSRQDDLLSKDYVFKDKIFLESELGFDFEYTYYKGDKETALKGQILDGQVTLLAPKRSGLFNMLIILVIILPIIFGGVFVVSGVKKRKKEEQYKQMLQQRYGQRTMQHPGQPAQYRQTYPGYHYPQQPQQRQPSYPQRPMPQQRQHPPSSFQQQNLYYHPQHPAHLNVNQQKQGR